MPEQPHPLIDGIARDLAAVNWPAPEEIRARARRRTILTSVAAPTAVALVLAGSWAALAGRPNDEVGPAPAASGTVSPAPTTSPSPLPTFVVPGDPAWIGPEALLQPDDVGPGMRLHDEDSFEPREQVPWMFDPGAICRGYRTLGIKAHRMYRYIRSHTVEREALANGIDAVHVQVVRYPDRVAEQVMGDVKRVVAACRSSSESVEASTPSHRVRVTHRWSIVGSGFAGDESLLLRNELVLDEKITGRPLGDRTVTLYAVVRFGDLVTVVQSDNRTAERMRQYGRTAVTRLCRTASPPC